MDGARQFARENGWFLLLLRMAGAAPRRIRDSFISRKLGAENFRCGGSPLLFGLSHMRIGRNFSAGDRLWLHAISHYGKHRFTPRLVIGEDVSASNNVHIACLDAVSIGSGTLFGSNVLVTDHAHGVYRGADASAPTGPPIARQLSSPAPVVIGKNVWVGDGVVILAGANIGDGCVIGANSVVTGILPAGTIAAGAPARPVRRWDADRAAWVAV